MSEPQASNDPPVLHYVSPAPAPEAHPGSWLAGASLVCGLIPVAGLLFRSGPMFLLGVTVIPLLGAFLATIACLCARRHTPDLGVAVVALVINAGFAGFGMWMIFVRGVY